MRERGIANYEAQIGVLVLAPQKKYDGIVTRKFCNSTKGALRATLVDATGTVRLLLSVWSECHEALVTCVRSCSVVVNVEAKRAA